MELKHASSVILFVWLVLFHHGCVYVGPTTGTDYATVEGGKEYITVSPTLTVAVPVHVALGDKVAEAAANAAVGYLKGLPGGLGAITQLNRAEAVQIGIDAGVTKAAETGQPVDGQKLEAFVQQVVAKI